MDKLKELIQQDWTVSATCDGGTFYLIATHGELGIIKSASHMDLEYAVTKLYANCMIMDKVEVSNE